MVNFHIIRILINAQSTTSLALWHPDNLLGHPHVNINYCVIVIFTYMGRKSIKSDKKIDIIRGLGPVTKVQPEVNIILDEQGPSGNTDQGTIS